MQQDLPSVITDGRADLRFFRTRTALLSCQLRTQYFGVLLCLVHCCD